MFILIHAQRCLNGYVYGIIYFCGATGVERTIHIQPYGAILFTQVDSRANLMRNHKPNWFLIHPWRLGEWLVRSQDYLYYVVMLMRYLVIPSY